MSNTEKLRECPFCGGEKLSVNVNNRSPNLFPLAAHVLCLSCLASVGSHGFEQTESEARVKAVNAWNRRAYDSMIISLGIEREVARRERDVAIRDMEAVDKCDTCRNSYSDERYYHEGEQEYYPRRHKCDSCYLGSGEQNNYEWRGLPNTPTPPRTNFDALTENPERLAEVLIKRDFDGYCPELPECVEGIEDGDYPTDECKQCLVDWLNGAVGE